MVFDPKEYWNKRLDKNYDLIGVGDISLSVNYNKWSYKITRIVLRSLFKKYTTGQLNKKVLDIGSGTGFVVDIWKELNKDVTGVDIAPVAVSRLQQLYPGFSFIESNIGEETLPLTENSFACCSAASVLYHIVDDEALEAALKNIHRVMEPDGVFIFSDNFIHEGNLNITHQKCRSLQDYEKLLTLNGFKITERRANYVLLNDPVDSKNKFIRYFWAFNTRLSKKYHWYDSLIWPVLFPVEYLLTKFMKESPAQEIIVCRAVK